MSYIGPAPNPGQNREVDDISSGFNGGTAAFTLQVNGQNVSPGSSNNIIVSLGGVIQNPGTDYTIAGSTITFTTNPVSGLSFFGLVLGQQVDIQSLADGTSPTMSAPSITGDLSIADKIVHTGDTNNAIRFPAADTITAETGGSERVRVDSSGNVGIGTNNPQTVLDTTGTGVIARFKSTNNNYVLSLLGNNASQQSFIGTTSAGDMTFATGSGVSERIRIREGGGLTFNGDTAAANALDDYEEVSFNPTVVQGIDGAATHVIQRGWAVKIGAFVHFSLFLRFSGTGNGNQFKVGGLPFTSANSPYSAAYNSGAFVPFTNVHFNNSNPQQVYIPNNVTNMEFYNGNNSNTSISGAGSNKDLYVVGMYRTDT